MKAEATKSAALRFADEHALRASLALVPAEVQAKGGVVVRGDDGALVITAELPADVRKALTKAGATTAKATTGTAFVHWAELVALEPDRDPDLREVLFVLPPDRPWLPLAAELVRLGCDDLELGWLEDLGGWAVRARRPSYFTVSNAGTAPWRVFARQAAAWVEVGWRHPMADRLVVPDGALLVIGRDGWRTSPVSAWADLADHLDLAIEPPVSAVPAPALERLLVHLRLRPGHVTHGGARSLPTLWQVPRAGSDVDGAVSALVRTLPDAVVDRLEFARFTLPTPAGPVDAALVRARSGAEPPTLEGLDPYVPHPQLPALFVPFGVTIDPPLRTRTLANLLDPGPGQIAWLEPRDQGVAVHRIAEEGFQPLADHVVYVAERDGDAVEAWLGATKFDWEPLDLPIVRDGPAREPGARERYTPPVRQTEPARVARPVTAQQTQQMVTEINGVVLEVTEWAGQAPVDAAERELQQLEAAYNAVADRDAPRDDLWVPMAERNHALGRHREAALCWTRAMWEAPAGDRTMLAATWSSRVGVPETLPETPSPEALTAVAAAVLAGVAQWDPRDLQRFLDAHDAPLDVRSRWLVRRRVAEQSGRDELALAKARDTVLASIRSGLAPVRDVPAFMRTSTTPEDRQLLAASLNALWRALEARIPTTAPVECTRAYGRMTVAWAQACLGLDGPAREGLDAAAAALPTSDRVHSVLLALYRSGIEEALAGLPAETPPPPESLAALAALDRLDRFKVERLREQSIAVLAETGTADAFTSFVKSDAPATLGVLPPDELLAAVRNTLDHLDEDEPAPGLLLALNAATALGESDAASVLQRVVATAIELAITDRVPVLVESASIAAALRRPEAMQEAMAALEAGLCAMAGRNAPSVVEPVRSLSRSLARCGLAEQARALFTAVRDAAPEDALVVRLRMSGAIAQVGGEVGDEIGRGLGMLEPGGSGASLAPNQRIAVVAAVADLATALPVTRAAAVWSALVSQAPSDQYSTNTHFALSFLKVTEILAAAHVHPDRLLGPAGRARIDRDEHRVRTRIHREDRF